MNCALTILCPALAEAFLSGEPVWSPGRFRVAADWPGCVVPRPMGWIREAGAAGGCQRQNRRIGKVLFLPRQAAEDLRAIHTEDSIGDDPVFGLSAQQVHHRLRVAARAAASGWRVFGPQRAGRDGPGPGRIGDRVARTDDGWEVVETDDADAVHVGAAGVAQSRGQVLRE